MVAVSNHSKESYGSSILTFCVLPLAMLTRWKPRRVFCGPPLSSGRQMYTCTTSSPSLWPTLLTGTKVKEQVIMVIEYLQQIKDSYFEQKHALEKQLNLLEIQLKENTGMIKMLEETNDSCYELFTPRNVNSKNKAKINELMEEQKSINESIENLKNSIKEYSSKIEQLDQIVEEENREIEIVQEYTEAMTQQNIVSEDEKKSSEDNLLDGMKNILNRVELCSQLIDIDPVRCRLELGSVMKILTDLIEEKDESDF